jgi:hypothetical protein
MGCDSLIVDGEWAQLGNGLTIIPYPCGPDQKASVLSKAVGIAKSFDFSIYPNPAREGVHLVLLAQSRELLTIEIYNALGTRVSELPPVLPYRESTDRYLDLRDQTGTPFPAGVYFIRVATPAASLTRSFTIIN